jgi:hypothetical protein
MLILVQGGFLCILSGIVFSEPSHAGMGATMIIIAAVIHNTLLRAGGDRDNGSTD